MDKIRRIFPLLILFTLLSCADTIETRIPYRAVYLELDLTYQDKALKAILAYKIYTPKNVDQVLVEFWFIMVYPMHFSLLTLPVLMRLRVIPL